MTDKFSIFIWSYLGLNLWNNPKCNRNCQTLIGSTLNTDMILRKKYKNSLIHLLLYRVKAITPATPIKARAPILVPSPVWSFMLDWLSSEGSSGGAVQQAIKFSGRFDSIKIRTFAYFLPVDSLVQFPAYLNSNIFDIRNISVNDYLREPVNCWGFR